MPILTRDMTCSPTPFQTEEDRPLFRPFTRESLAQIEARIQEEKEKKKELEKKRAEREVRKRDLKNTKNIKIYSSVVDHTHHFLLSFT